MDPFEFVGYEQPVGAAVKTVFLVLFDLSLPPAAPNKDTEAEGEVWMVPLSAGFGAARKG